MMQCGKASQARHTSTGGQLARALLIDVHILVYCVSLPRSHPREELCTPLGEMCRSLRVHQKGSGFAQWRLYKMGHCTRAGHY